MKDKVTDYRLTFGNEAGKTVLADLRNFCFATKTTFNGGKTANQTLDPLYLARMEGRREVFLQVMGILKVDFDDYYTYTEDLND